MFLFRTSICRDRKGVSRTRSRALLQLSARKCLLSRRGKACARCVPASRTRCIACTPYLMRNVVSAATYRLVSEACCILNRHFRNCARWQNAVGPWFKVRKCLRKLPSSSLSPFTLAPARIFFLPRGGPYCPANFSSEGPCTALQKACWYYTACAESIIRLRFSRCL